MSNVLLSDSRRSLRRVVVSTVMVAVALMPLSAGADEKADAYYNQATEYLAKGETKSAVIQLKNALQRDPGHVQARVMLARLYLAAGDAQGAEKEFMRAGELGVDPGEWMVGYGQALLLQKRAKDVLEKVQIPAEAVATVKASVLALRGQAYLMEEDPDQAQKAFEAALAFDDTNLLARMGRVRMLSVQGKTEEALAEASALTEAHPDNFTALLLKGDLLREMQRFDEAEKAFSKARELAPGDPRGHIGVALTHLLQDKLDDALADAERMRKQFNGRLPMASYVHAVAAYRKGDLDTAGEQLLQLLTVAPNLLQAQVLYGIVNYSQGKLELAEDYLTRVHSQLKDDPVVTRLLAATYLRLNRAQNAIELLQPIADTGAEDAQLFALIGTAYLQLGQYEKGSDFLSRAVKLAPDLAGLRTQLAVGQMAAGKSSSAVGELEKAVDLGQGVIQADVLLVLSHIQAKDLDKALQAAEDLKKRMPGSPVPVNLVGLAHLAAKDYPQAIAAFNDALRIDPEFNVAYLNLARASLLDNKPDAAAEYLHKLLSKEPKHSGAMLGLAGLAKQQGDAAGYESWVTKAYEAHPQSVETVVPMARLLLEKKEPLKATTVLNAVSGPAAKNPAVIRMRGLTLVQLGEFSNAARSFRQLVDKLPNWAEAWFQLGRAQAATGDLTAARQSFERSIALSKDGNTPLPLMAMGELDIKQQRWTDALTIADRLVKEFPKVPAGFELRAAAYRGQGNESAALDAMEQAVRIDGTEARTNIFAFNLVSNGQADRAISLLETWLDKHPDDAQTRGNLGLIQQKSGKTEAALKNLEVAARAGTTSPAVLNNLAWLYLERGDKRAIDTGRRAYELAPQRAEIIDTYGWVLFNFGEEKDGLRLLQQALVLAPRHPEIGLHVAEALHRSGRDKEAVPLVERVIKDHPDSEWQERARDLRAKLTSE